MAVDAPVAIEYTDLFINNEFVPAANGARRDILNPATGEVIARVADATEQDMERAIAAARAAFEGPWRELTAKEREQLLLGVANKIKEHADELAALETLNNGKPIREAEYDIADAAACFEYYAGLATKIRGETLTVPANSHSFVVREPIGVVGQIIPWNYPLLMAAWKLAPALAAGNCCILKPAEYTPLTALKLASFFQELGFPEGVVNIVPGDGPTVGALLARHHDVDKIAFTGGVDTGRLIMAAAATNIKKITLELGGKSPNVIFADADWAQAIDGALFGIFCGSGQVCSAGSRLVLERSIYDKFVEELAEKAAKIRVGQGRSARTEMGPLVSQEQLDRVKHYVEVGKKEGARLVLGGQQLTGPGYDGGYFFAPTIFADVDSKMTVAQEEIFGPVLVVIPFDTEEEAINIANDTIFGLAGAVFTKDGTKALRVVSKIRAGITWINSYHSTYNEAPWGGYKQSGIGRELGAYGLDAYLEVKQVNVDLSDEPVGWFDGEPE